MRKLSKFLKYSWPIFLIAGLIYTFLGIQAEVSTGKTIITEFILDYDENDMPLNNHSRFYGVVYILYGVLLYQCSVSLRKNLLLLKLTLGGMFLVGLMHLGSMFLFGVTPLKTVRCIVEIGFPVIVFLWLRTIETDY